MFSALINILIGNSPFAPHFTFRPSIHWFGVALEAYAPAELLILRALQ
jgi:hypothetical protein